MPSIGFGTWAWGNKFLWGYEPEKYDHILKNTFEKAIFSGLSFIDTADSYGTGRLNGRSEELLGFFFKNLPQSKLNKITLATKLAPYPWRVGRQGFKSAFDASKKRLNGKLDRVQLHWSTSRYAPWQEEQLINGLGDLVEDGLVSEIGVSNMGPERLKSMHNRLKLRGLKLKSLQIQFSLLSPSLNKIFKTIDTCKNLDIELIAYSPLALGVLAIPPEVEPMSMTLPRKTIFNRLLPSSQKLRSCMKSIAKKRGVSQSQVALNWCRSYGAMPIVGIRDPLQAIDAAAALNWQLSPTEKKELTLLSKDCDAKMPNNPFQSR